MPDDFAHFMDATRYPSALPQLVLQTAIDPSNFDKSVVRACPAVTDAELPMPDALHPSAFPSMRELLSQNGELALHNRLLTVALARLQAAAAAAAKPAARVANLTPRQQQIMTLVLAGHPSKNIAADLHISQRTVENHRAAIMRRTGAASIPALVRLSLA